MPEFSFPGELWHIENLISLQRFPISLEFQLIHFMIYLQRLFNISIQHGVHHFLTA